MQKSSAADLTEVTQRLESCAADPELIALAKRCLAPQATDRPADAHAVAVEVAAYRAGVEQRLREAEQQAAAALECTQHFKFLDNRTWIVRATPSRQRLRGPFVFATGNVPIRH